MKKVMIEIDEAHIPEGYSVTEFRIPRLGDYYIGVHSELCEARGGSFTGPRLILKPLPKWPAWLKARFVAMDADGEWWAYSKLKPILDDEGTWYTGSDDLQLHPAIFDLSWLPTDVAFEDSLIQNPNWSDDPPMDDDVVPQQQPGDQIDQEV